jgi:carbon storage regulator
MLVLSRKRSEQIVIGSEIRITVVKLEGNQVRIGIEAPEDLTVLRAELVRETDGWNPPSIDPGRYQEPGALAGRVPRKPR